MPLVVSPPPPLFLPMYIYSTFSSILKFTPSAFLLPVAAPEFFFFLRGIEGAKCDSEGAKIQKFAENGWFWTFFLLTGGSSRGQSLRLGGAGKCPHAPPPWCRHCLLLISPPFLISRQSLHLPLLLILFHSSSECSFLSPNYVPWMTLHHLFVLQVTFYQCQHQTWPRFIPLKLDRASRNKIQDMPIIDVNITGGGTGHGSRSWWWCQIQDSRWSFLPTKWQPGMVP